MKDILKQCMDEGAVGIWLRLLYTSNCFTDVEELITLSSVVAT